MRSIRIFTGIALLLAASVATASFWVSRFDGPAEDYRIERNGQEVPLQQLMLLDSQDVLHLLNDSAVLVIVDEGNERTAITAADSPFVVPESDDPPGLLLNVRNWIAGWWQTRANQNTTTLSAVSKGSLEPTVLVANRHDNRLLGGNRKLFVAWTGGSPPFDIVLADDSGVVIAEAAETTEYSVTLPASDLVAGHRLEIRVSGGLGEDVVPIVIVDEDELPDSARAVVELELPETITHGNLAFVVSGLAPWRFEALQLANSHGLSELSKRLLSNMPPQVEEAELNDALSVVD